MTDKQIQTVDATPVQSRAMAEAKSQADNFISMIERVASNPDADVDKMERLYAMSKDMMDRRAAAEYNAAMCAVQTALPAILRKEENKQTNSTYAKLGQIITAIRPVYTAHGFSLSFSEGESPQEGYIRVLCDVSHTGGDVRTFHYDSPMDLTGIAGKVNKTETHGKASAVTYGQRYLTNGIFLLEFTDDDDGNAAGGDRPEGFNQADIVAATIKGIEHGRAFMVHADTILAIKDGIVEGQLDKAAEAWFELDDSEKALLWLAPTKGGVFTTKEREIIKSSEFREAHFS